MVEIAEGLEEESQAKVMTFWEHTEELVSRLKVVLYSFFIFFITMMIAPGDLSFLSNPLQNYQPFLAVVLRRIREDILPPDVKLIGLEMMNPLTLYLMASLMFGISLTIPVIIYEAYKFIDPALYPHERKELYPVLTSFFTLFIGGLTFGYMFLTPYLMQAMVVFFPLLGVEKVISVMDFYTLVLLTTLATGIIFTFPVFLVLLVKYGVIGTNIITKNRKYVYAGLLIICMLITPGEGGVANFMLFIPMSILLEGGLLFAKRYEKKGTVHKVFKWSTEKSSCKFCGESLHIREAFCPKCGRSQK
ncbi:MAG: twin-arginine translocase subunit TatC [Candidatus Bathyarchaeia archaeon]